MNRRDSHLLSGILVCSSCGRRMHSSGNRYVCKSRVSGYDCPAPVQIAAAPLEANIEETFLRRFDSKTMGRVRQPRIQQTWQRRADKLRARADELTGALDKLADERYVKGSLSAADYQRQQLRFLAEREDVIAQATELDSQSAAARPLDTSVLALWPKMPVADRRRQLAAIIDKIIVLKAGPGVGASAKKPSERIDIHWLA